MPTNLPPNYYKVEAQFRAARSAEEKLAYLEEMYSLVPKHKGTDHLRADLRRRMAELRSEPGGGKGPAKQTTVYHIERAGAGSAVIVGVANVGKSALVRALTNAEPEVSPAPFSTWAPTPGIMIARQVQIQLIDTPPLNEDYIDPGFLGLIQRADVLVLMVDLQAYPIQQLEDALAILDQHHIAPLQYRERYEEPFRWRLLPCIVLVNKVDETSHEEDFEVLCELLEDVGLPLLPISATTGRHVEKFEQAIFEVLDIIRVYAKPPGREPDLSTPFVLPRGSTVEDFAAGVHRDLREKLKSARIWGYGVHDGQPVSREHVLHDGDVVELHV